MVGAERVAASLRVVDDAATRVFFTFRVTRQVPEPLVLSPVIDVARGMGPTLSVGLSSANGGTVHNRPIIDQPKDSDAKFKLITSHRRPSHWAEVLPPRTSLAELAACSARP